MRRPRRSSAKFVMYFDLLIAFAERGCPVCRLLEQSSRKTLDALLYEQVNDPESRQTLVASRGFCNWHTWMMREMQVSRLGVALIGHHLLVEAIRAVGNRAAPAEPNWRQLFRQGTPQGAEGLSAWWRAGKGCPVCARLQRSERDSLRVLLDYFDEEEFAGQFARSGGLCIPHLCRALDGAPEHRSLPALIAAHCARWTALQAELDEFIRKHDYRFASEPMGAEGDSWSRTLEVLAGRPGLFGTERSRRSPGTNDSPRGSGQEIAEE